MSTLAQAEIVNALLLIALLQADLGPHRKIAWHRILRPILIAAGIVPLFLEKVSTHGGGLTVELAGVAAGAVGGLLALTLIRVYRSGTTAKPVSAARWGYGLLWTGVIAARATFSYGADHWFNNQLTHWLVSRAIPSAAITDGLIFMAIAMLTTRTVGLAIRAHSISEGSKKAAITPSYTQA
jgi:hypothetical protein